VLSGQYPTNTVDWGTSGWYLSSPWGLFTTNSVGFNGPAPHSAVMTLIGSRVLVRVDAYNGATTASTVTIACAGQTTVTATVGARQLLQIPTGWSVACATITFTSTNGWDTNFDNFVLNPV
jgi:hypothetical protein